MQGMRKDGPTGMNDHNGWKNYATWNVSLWIENDSGLYYIAKRSRSYNCFVESIKALLTGPIALKTPDDVAWNDTELDLDALNEMIKEL